MSRLRACAISTSPRCAAVGIPCSAGDRRRIYLVICCCGSWLTSCRLTGWVTSMMPVGVCLIAPAASRLREGVHQMTTDRVGDDHEHDRYR
jgi:hypothetical protein